MRPATFFEGLSILSRRWSRRFRRPTTDDERPCVPLRSYRAYFYAPTLPVSRALALSLIGDESVSKALKKRQTGESSRSSLLFRNCVHVYGRQVVVPVVVRRPFMALVTLRLAPHRATLRTLTVRVECVPGVPTLAGPPGAGRRFPLALWAVDFHWAQSIGT